MSNRDLILCYSDEHLRQTGSFPPFNNFASSGLSCELENILTGFLWVGQQIRQLAPRAVFGLGDLFHNADLISAMTLHAAGIGLGYIASACKDVGCKHWRIWGNHDLFSDRHGISSISCLAGFEHVPDATTVDLGGYRVGLVPYCERAKAYLDLVDAQARADLILTHLDFDGAQYDSGQVAMGTIDPNLAKPCISGHIHPVCDVGQVHYVGSLIQNRFARKDLSRVGGILVWDINAGTFQRTPNTASKHYVKAFSVDDVLRYKPEQAVFQIVTTQPKEEVEAALAGYDFFYTRQREESDGPVRAVYSSGVGAIDPEQMLRSFVQRDNEAALDVFDAVMSGKNVLEVTQ